MPIRLFNKTMPKLLIVRDLIVKNVMLTPRIIYHYETCRIKRQARRLLEQNKATPLTDLLIEINSACNRKCPWCPNHKNTRPTDRFLDEKLFYKIIDEARGMKFKGSVSFNLFNEPLIDKRIVTFIKYVRKTLPFSYIYLNTNGDFLSFELWQNMRNAGLDKANISQYEGKFSKNIQAILTAITREETKHFNAYIFDPQNINNRAGLVNTKNQVPITRYCDRPFSQLCVTYEGKVVLCCNDYFGQVEIGDIKTQSIQEVWNDRIYMCYRKELLKGNRANLDLCKLCDM